MPPDYGVKCSPIFHLSETSEESQSPAEHRSPEDSRFPSHSGRTESPRVRAQEPHPKLYPYRGNADIFATKEANDIQKKPGAHPRRFDKPFPTEDWNQENFATLTGTNGNRHMDSEMADQSVVNSRGLTPQSSNSYNPSSSNTSYSPSQAHDEDPQNPSINSISGVNSGPAGFMPGLSASTSTATATATPQPPPHHHNHISTSAADDPFKIPAGWDLTTSGMTPNGGGGVQGMDVGSMTGMTPDGGWEKLMDSIGWETGRTV